MGRFRFSKTPCVLTYLLFSLNRIPAGTVSAKSVLGSGDPDKLVQLCVWPSAGQGRTVTSTRLKNKMGILLPGYKLWLKWGQRRR